MLEKEVNKTKMNEMKDRKGFSVTCPGLLHRMI